MPSFIRWVVAIYEEKSWSEPISDPRLIDAPISRKLTKISGLKTLAI
jgi:hypothetical protein